MSGIKRVLQVYPLWLLIWAPIVAGMLLYKVKAPTIVLILALFFLFKDILVDFFLIRGRRPRMYWAEHAPLMLLFGTVGVLGALGYAEFYGYVSLAGTALAFTDFAVDTALDLKEHPSSYGPKYAQVSP